MGNKRLRIIRWNKRIKVSMSESSITKAQFREIMRATNNFSKEHIIGLGRTTILYRAALENGTIYTVKRSQYTIQLRNECALKMSTIGSVRHPNLVPLLGYFVANQELFMVYEHMLNGSLYDHLHSSPDNFSIREWPLLRLKIAVGAARGLACLHHYCTPRVIHRNISSRSILLDADFFPKISDFALETLKNPINGEYLSNYVKRGYGVSGFLVPEHARTRVITPKEDVYCFGVVLFELITGETPFFLDKARDGFEWNVVEWVMQLSSSSKLEDAVDRCLIGKGFDAELFEFLKVACNCVALDPKKRPSMSEVYRLLTAIVDDQILGHCPS